MRFRVPVLALEGTPTDDGRTFQHIAWRDLPLTLYAQHTNAMGHDQAPIAGSLDEITRGADGVLEAVIDTDDDGAHGIETARLIQREDLRGISVDLGLDESTIEIVDHFDPDTGDYVGSDFLVGEATILAATVVGMPAFGAANQIDPTPLDGDAGLHLVAAATPRSDLPPASWFEDPQLDGPTPLTVTDDGRVYGHLAAWGTCHIGYDGVCVTPPHSQAGYAYFRTGEVLASCTDGCQDDVRRVAVGTLTMDTGHAQEALQASPAAAHYDDTGVAAADVAVGEDAHGIWCAGAVRPEVLEDPNRLRRLRASAPSGDWRRIGGQMELVAALAVNVPGFPVTRQLVASGSAPELRTRVHVQAGVQTALVAAGIVYPDPSADRGTVTAVRDPRVDMLVADRAAELAASVRETVEGARTRAVERLAARAGR